MVAKRKLNDHLGAYLPDQVRFRFDGNTGKYKVELIWTFDTKQSAGAFYDSIIVDEEVE